MSPPNVDSNPLSDAFKAKVTNLIQEQLKPIVDELASQQETLLNHLSLLKHNHNVNDYQMTRLENIRDLEQSINFKVTGALGFCPWQHPSMGTNLHEPVPADPLRIPQFVPVNYATRAERAATSAALIEEAGISAQRLGVPLTLQDFPREQVNHPGEDTMHSSVPLFGLDAPRWRSAEGLPEHDQPGTASYDGVLAIPMGKRGLQGWEGTARRKRAKKKPLWKLVEEGADPYGIGVPPPSSSSIVGAGTSLLEELDVPAREPSAGSSSTSLALTTPALFDFSEPHLGTDPHTPNASSSAPPRTGLDRTETMATFGSTTTAQSPVPLPGPLRRAGAMAHVGPTPQNEEPPTDTTLESAFHAARAAVLRAAAEKEKEKNDMANSGTSVDNVDVGSTAATTTTTTSLSRTSTMATIGSSHSPVSRKATTSKTAKAKSTTKSKSTSKSKPKPKPKTIRTAGPQRRRKRSSTASTSAAATTTTPSAPSSTTTKSTPTPTQHSTFTPTNAPKRTLKRARTTADDEQEEVPANEDDAEPPHKRLKRATAPSPSPTIGRLRGTAAAAAEPEIEAEDGVNVDEHTGSHLRGRLRRSTRVTRASAAAAPAPARRGQATGSKKSRKN